MSIYALKDVLPDAHLEILEILRLGMPSTLQSIYHR